MILQLLTAQCTSDFFTQTIQALQGLPAIIYGAGYDALALKELLQSNGVETSSHLVDDAFLEEKHLVGDNVYLLKPLCQQHPQFNVIIGFHSSPEHTQQQINALNNCSNIINVFQVDFTWWKSFDGYYQNDLTKREVDYDEVYRLFSDELSKKVFLGFISAKISHNPYYLNNLQSFPQYFPDNLPQFTPTEKDIFVDGGAFNGDTLQHVIELTGGKGCAAYYAFEPDEKNFKQLLTTVKNNKLDFVNAINKGLWSEVTTLSFSGDAGDSSSVSEHGIHNIATFPIDQLDDQVSFIKMDIEGAELEAIEGARTTIQKHTPKLAITLYHDPRHLTEVPKLIKEICPDYQFYLRLHSYFSRELVLYACI